MERAMIAQALHAARFNKSRAARALGLTRHQLYVRMRRYGLLEHESEALAVAPVWAHADARDSRLSALSAARMS
jgi:hypothetical protein